MITKDSNMRYDSFSRAKRNLHGAGPHAIGSLSILQTFTAFLQFIGETGEEWHTSGCAGFSGMLRSFVTTLQDDYKR